MSVKNLMVGVIAFALIGCGGSESTEKTAEKESDAAKTTETTSAEPSANKGIGPVTAVELGEIDATMASAGETTFNTKCTACHTLDSKVIGPALAGVTEKRTPEWIMNMMLNPTEMLANDADAKALLEEYNNIPMMPLGLTEDEAREVLEFLRTAS